MAEDTPLLLSLEDLIPANLRKELEQLSPGISWALDSLVVSFGQEVQNLDPAAREAFARLTLAYGESLDRFLQLAQTAGDEEVVRERDRKMGLLRGLELFRDLNDFDLGQIAAAFQPIEIEPGHILAREGEEGEAVFFLESGRVGIVVGGNQVAIRGEGALFGETSCVTGEPVTATLRAVSACHVLRMSRVDFEQRVLKLAELTPKIASLGFTRLDEATQRLSEVLSHMPDALLKIDRDGIITGDVSRKCFEYLEETQLTGYRFAELFFKDHHILLEEWDEEFPKLQEHPDLFNDPNFTIPKEAEFLLQDGSQRHYALALNPCYRHDAHEGFDVAISDLTEQKRIEADRRRMEQALQQRKRQFMLLRVGDEVCGLAVETILEIVESPHITRLPHAPPFLRGFFNMRSRIIPAVDVRILLELPPSEQAGRGCICIVELERAGQKVPLGLVANDVEDILEVFENNIAPPPDFGSRKVNLRFLQGIAHTDERMVMLLDVDGLLTLEQRRTVEKLHPEQVKA